MLFKDLKDYALLLTPIPRVEGVLKAYYKRSKRSISKKTTLDFLHYRYIMDLVDISTNTQLSLNPSNLRVLESDERGPLALHDLSLDWKKPRLLSTKLGPIVFSNIFEATFKIKEKLNQKEVGEIRHLSIPELNMEVVWHQYEDGAKKNHFYFRKFSSNEMIMQDEPAFTGFISDMKNELFEMQKIFKGKHGDPKKVGISGA